MGMGAAAGMKTKASKIVGGLNKEGGLQQPIMYKEVAELFMMLGDDDSIKLLRELEEKKDDIRDPTGWLKVGAKNKLDARGGKDGKTRASKIVGGMNKEGGLQQPIMYKDVADLFNMIGDEESIKLLRELEEKKSDVRDPTGWLK